jgi:hypothetical protein
VTRLLRDHRIAARSALKREAVSFFLKLTSVLVGFVGMGLLVAAVVLGTARLVGPILAPALVGVVLLSLAAVLWFNSRSTKRQPLQEAKAAETTATRAVAGTVTGAEAAFAAGFVLGRLLVRKFVEQREP